MGVQRELDRYPLHFGPFELDPASGELRKHGVRVRLQDQPLKLLLCLLDTPGQVWTREELIRQIWPEGTFVDYERGLNVAITRLRQTLGDTAGSPRYIETVGRRGYRFIAPVSPAPRGEAVYPSSELAVPEPTAAGKPAAELPQSDASRLWLSVAIAAVAFALVAAFGWWRAVRLRSQPLIRVSIDLGREVLAQGPGTSLALSADGGRAVIVVKGSDGNNRLALRRLDQGQLALLGGTERAASPFFSPDGQWIAFFADGKLKKIAVPGGVPVTLADASNMGPAFRYPSGSWGDDGNIVAMLNPAEGLVRISSAGGPARKLPGLTKGGDEIDIWPQVLPGSQEVLFTRHTGDSDDGDIEIYSFRTWTTRRILEGGFLGRYLPGGHLVYLRGNTLFAVPFNIRKLETTGAPRRILEDVGSRLGWWSFDFSANGAFLYAQPGNPQLSLFWLDDTGKTAALPVPPATWYEGPSFSRDGQRVAFSSTQRDHQDIWVQDLDRGAASRLTALPGVNDTPLWTVDGQFLLFRSIDQPNPGIYYVRSDSSGEPRRLLDFRAGEFPYSVSPDGHRLIIWDRRGVGSLWVVSIESTGQTLSAGRPQPLLLKQSVSAILPGRMAPAFSPDGRWIAYCSNESGRLEVFVIPFPGPGSRTQVSTHGGKFPVWSRKTRELFFLDLNSTTIMATSYEERGDSFVVAKPRMWSGKTLLDIGRAKSFDLSPDGRRFVAVLYADGTSDQRAVTNVPFLLNFFDELRRRVPAGQE